MVAPASLPSVGLARALRSAGLVWRPARGDRFVLQVPEMEHDVFVLSDMTVEVHDFPTGRVIGFNGTTEWALDSVEQSEALWLPGEDQLRDLLEHRLDRLERTPEGYRVVLADGTAHEAPAAAEAYGRAVLGLLRELRSEDPGADLPTAPPATGPRTGQDPGDHQGEAYATP